jgi:RHS repeat-associated protein
MAVILTGSARRLRHLAVVTAGALAIALGAPAGSQAAAWNAGPRPAGSHTAVGAGVQAKAAARAAAARAAALRTTRRPLKMARRPLRMVGERPAARPKRPLVNHDLAGETPVGVTPTPLARAEANLAFDQATGQLVMFGGVTSSTALMDDTWTWDGVAWKEQFPATAPSPVNGFGAEMAYDSARKYVLLVSEGNTFTWDGSNWTKLSPASSPPIAGGGSMVYDPAAGVDVLFGGFCLAAGDPGCDASSGISTATWTWDGTAWSMHAASGGLAGLVFGSPTAMTYDAANGTVVLDSRSSVENTEPFPNRGTYVWNVQGWSFSGTGVEATVGSSALPSLGNLAYDPATGTVIDHLLEEDASGFTHVTLSWNGSAWSQPAVGEPAQVLATIAVDSSAVYDPAVSQIVEFGGTSLVAEPGGAIAGDGETSATYGFDGKTWISLDAVLDNQMLAPNADMNPGQCSVADPVNTATGDFWEQQTDVSIPGPGIPLNFTRTYNSANAGGSGPLGPGWTNSYSTHLAIDAKTGNVTLIDESGDSMLFTKLPSGAYEAPNRVLSALVQDPDGSFTLTRHDTTALTFNSAGQLTAETDRNGYVTKLTYNSSGQLASVTDSEGRALRFAYTGGLLQSVTDVTGGRTWTYGYDANGNLASVTDPNTPAGVQKYTYDGNHLLLTMTDPDGNTTTNTYDTSGRVKTQASPAVNGVQRVTRFDYQGTPVNGNTTVTDPRGIVSTCSYVNGLLASRSVATGNGNQVTWTYTYNADDSVAAVTDPNGHTTTSVTDEAGNVIARTDGRGNTWFSFYNQFNEPLASEDPKGVTTDYRYDNNGNLKQVINDATGLHPRTVSYAYGDPAHPGDVTQVTDANGKNWEFGYDSNGDLASVTDPLGDKTTKTYDGIGQMATSVVGNGNVADANPADFTTKYGHDALGHLTSVTLPLAGSPRITYTYDPNGNQLTETDATASKNKTTWTYDPVGELTQVQRPDGSKLTTTYDNDGNVASQTDGQGHVTSYTDDNLNHLATVTDPLQAKTQYVYDAVGNLLQVIDPQNRTTTRTYDPANNLATVSYSDGKTHGVTYTYDPLNRRATMTDGTGKTTWTYDDFGAIASVTNGAGEGVGYGYDNNGNTTSITYPGTTGTVKRTFDDANRLATVTDWLGNEVKFGYDEDGNLRTATYPGGVTREITYDHLDHTTSVAVTNPPSTLFAANYTHDNDERLATISGSADPSATYSYDQASRLLLAGTASSSGALTSGYQYTYDNADRIDSLASTTPATSSTLTYNNADQLVTETGTNAASYTYDPEGDRITTTHAGNSTTTLNYNQAGQLTGYGSTSYVYNGDGLRMRKETSSGGTEPFTWDLTQPAPALVQDGSTDIIDGPGGLPLEQVTGSGTVTYFQADQLGSTRLLTTPTGTAAATYTYDPYGNLTASTGTATTSLRYAGQFFDPESGYYYLRARYYDPKTAQFITRDPVSPATQPYAYTADNPANNIDPSGQFCIGIGSIEIGFGCPSGGNTSPNIDQCLIAGALRGGVGGDTSPGNSNVSPSKAQPNFQDPTQSPGPGWIWRGTGPVGSRQGSWYNPSTDQSLHPDLNHSEGIPPHYDYTARNIKGKIRIFPGDEVPELPPVEQAPTGQISDIPDIPLT